MDESSESRNTVPISDNVLYRIYGRAWTEGIESGPIGISEAATVDQDQPPDKHMQEREAEKTADLESLADALAALRQPPRDLDQWGRGDLAAGFRWGVWG